MAYAWSPECAKVGLTVSLPEEVYPRLRASLDSLKSLAWNVSGIDLEFGVNTTARLRPRLVHQPGALHSAIFISAIFIYKFLGICMGRARGEASANLHFDHAGSLSELVHRA